jgi:uncharacterized protein
MKSLNKNNFVGREQELKTLLTLLDKKTASLVVVRGRRRIGKSRLIEEFAKRNKIKFYPFSGLPLTKNTTAATQREAFAKQLQKYFNIPIKSDDWWDLLWFLSEQTQNEQVLILLDEISWLGNLDQDFLGKLKTVWDNNFKKNSNLILVLCGSVSTWIEENILGSSGFLGRISSELTLTELSINEAILFWNKTGGKISALEKFKILAVTGGIPRYLEEIDPHVSAEENIRRLCFSPSGILFNEFERIFSDLFDSKSIIYKKIVTYLADVHRATRREIAKEIGLQVGGIISDYLNDLVKAGFLTRDISWHFKSAKPSRLSLYRLSDNYLRFYLKYILPNKSRIEAGNFIDYSITALPAITSILGLQFENLILNNRRLLKKFLNIKPGDVVCDGPYLQRKTSKQLGCQIDYLIQTKYNSIYLCEIKFSQNEIKESITTEITEKINRLKLPKRFSVRTVLIHVSDVSDTISDSGFFAQILDFADLLES